MRASSVAVAVAEALAEPEAVAEEDGEPLPGGDLVPDGELVPDGDPVPEGEAVPVDGEVDEPAGDGEGDHRVLLGLVPDDGEVGDAEGEEGDAEGEEEDGEGDGDGFFDGGCGVRLGSGVGVAVAGSGRATHEVAAFVPEPWLPLALWLGRGLWLLLGSALGVVLVLALGLGEAALGFAPLARAVPGNPARTPTVMELPASTLSTATRRCARRMKKTALSSLLIEVTVCSSCDSEATW